LKAAECNVLEVFSLSLFFGQQDEEESSSHSFLERDADEERKKETRKVEELRRLIAPK
jgi:hypothetical protein